jgi:hypothetical protein
MGRVLLASFSCFHGFLIFTAEVTEDAEKELNEEGRNPVVPEKEF